MKIYAKQVAPEYQESPLFLDECFPDNIILDGNSYCKSHTTPEYEQIKCYFDEMAGEWENQNFYYEWAGSGYTKHKKKPDYNIAEILKDYGFTRTDGKAWSNEQKHEWRLLMEREEAADDEKVILTALELLTGHKWESGTIRGCCQSDWQDIYYRVDKWNREALNAFEIEYFNTGTEWIVDDGEFDPENDSPLNINGCSTYCTEWNEDGIKREIADAFGGSPEDVVLYAFEGWSRTPNYREVG